MQDETQEILSHGILDRSPESPCLKTSSNSNINNKEQDRFLPIANVGRIMKKILPPNGKISKDAKETVQECVSEFISFVTGEASEKCQREKRKTINGDDIIWAITTLDFEEYIVPLKTYLSKYRETEGEKINNSPKQQRSEQRQQQHQQNHYQFHQQEQNISCNNSYLIPQPHNSPFSRTDQHGFVSPFSSDSFQNQFPQQQDEIEYVEHYW